jgi:hypothetical protein
MEIVAQARSVRCQDDQIGFNAFGNIQDAAANCSGGNLNIDGGAAAQLPCDGI